MTTTKEPELPVQELERVTIRFAGDSGDGMQLTGTQFTRTAAVFGNDISTLPDFPAEIRAPAGSLPGVSGVFFGQDFITVTKANGEWQHLKPAILGLIMEHYLSGAPIITRAAAAAETGDEDFAEADREIVGTIKELLETRVRPAVAQDGGDITFQGYRDGVVYLNMKGSCSGCPSSTATLKHGIENLLRHFIPEVSEVRPV